MFKKTLIALATVAGIGLSSSALAYQNVTPTEAYSMVQTDSDVMILDVRTRYEWGFVGHPSYNPKTGEGYDLEGRVKNVAIMVVSGEEVVPNQFFIDDVKALMAENPNMKFITMCRSGKRSVQAAMMLEQAGVPVMNMAQGFEGSSDSAGYRTINGWKNAGLPYTAACDGNGYDRYKFSINDAGKLVPPNNGNK